MSAPCSHYQSGSAASNSTRRSGYNRNRRKTVSNTNTSKLGISHQRNGYDGMTNDNYEDDDYDEFGYDDELSGGSLGDKIVRMFRKVGLLVWKNLLLRRRHWLVTLLEIILPTLCAMLMAAGKSQSGGHDSVNLGTENQTTIFPAITEANLLTGFRYAASCRGCFMAYSPNDITTQNLMQDVKNFLPGTNIDFTPVNTEHDIETLLASLNFNDTLRSKFRGAVVFESGLDKTTGPVSYKIRLVDKLTTTGDLFPTIQLPIPTIEHVNTYVETGFIGLQLAIDKAIANLITGKTFTLPISLQGFPYPPYTMKIDFAMFYHLLLPSLFVLGFIFMVPSILRAVVSEKETGIRELLKLNGLPSWMQWFGWMINSMIVMSISVTIVVFLLFWTFDMHAGAVLVYSDPTVWWMILFLYAMSSSAFCFFISSFFRRPTLATTVGIILWLSSYYFFFSRIEGSYQSMSLSTKLLFSLLPNLAMHLGIKVMTSFEFKAAGARWYNIAEPLSSVDPLSLGHVIMMFLINTVMYMALTIYIENVFPSEYGVRKPWYYIFQMKTWFRTGKGNQRVLGENDCGDDISAPGFESGPSDGSAGIQIRNLKKCFGRNKVAVNGVSANMYDGEIFALLGHNGAGKTTTISLLTGLYAPSGGTASINGYDINTDLDRVRQNMGLCPQHNMLFDKLTVSEHLRFFGQLKGLNRLEATKQSKEILEKLQLLEKENTLSMSLSGGQKRKLSLGIALIGGTRVVILDEPTSGMDPEARRAIWDLLLEMRGQRTILLTTHFMEEADVLGDRIGVMANGELKCCGTPMFLKKYYGTGYNLKITLVSNASQENLLQTVQTFIHNASLKPVQGANSSEVVIMLPTETATTTKLSEMFSTISQRKTELGIQTIGLSLTTMDEVFLKVGELAADYANANVRSVGDCVDGSPSSCNKVTDERITLKSDKARARGLKLAMEQYMAIITKKFLYTLRKRTLMLSQLLIPIVVLAIAVVVSNANFAVPPSPPPRDITIDPYKSPVTLFTASDLTLRSILTSIIGPSSKEISPGVTLLDAISKVGVDDLAQYRERYIVAAEVNDTNFNAMANSIPNHAAPLAINFATNTLLRSLNPSLNRRIQVTNHPMMSKMESLLEAAKPNPIFSQTVPIMFAVFMPIGLALLAACFVVFPVEERLCKAKQLQIMTGVSPLTYWSATFTWDFLMVLIVVCGMTACFPIFQSHDVFTSYGGAGVAFLILLVYGYSAISFSYIVSLFVSTVPGGFALVSILHIATGIVLSVVIHIMEVGGNELSELSAKFRWIGRLFPTFGAAVSTMRFSEIATTNGRCNILSEEAKRFICDASITNVPTDYRECCDNCAELGAVCFKPVPYITWTYQKSALIPGTQSDAVPGIGQELLYMFILGVIYQVVLLILEYGVIQIIQRYLYRTDEYVFKADISDDDVKNESERVSGLVSSGTTNSDALVVDNFCKSYGSFAAVSKVSFGVHHGECFGLLGVNGAGKTTTFEMLTGDKIRSHGNAYAMMNTLEKNRKKFLSDIGYCPQFDGIIGVLTGREMLQLFCRLRGIPGRFGQQEADKWLTRFGLLESANVQCRKYSGGMKRRLSVAMAMIGDPPLLLLDEPTSGVDPVSRRQFWEILAEVRDSGQSIILTSHSMEECEALCSRLGIMVNGQLQCLGGVQHLKNKFAQGYSLTLKLKPEGTINTSDVNNMSEEIIKRFHPCALKDKHQNLLQYQINNTMIDWDMLFKTMEDLKTKYGDIIEDYSVNETSLEEIFLSFARKQYGNRVADVSLFQRIITCQLC